MTQTPPVETPAPVTPKVFRLGNVSPSKLKKFLLCPARAVAQSVDEDYEDDQKMELTLAGTLAHAAAKFWYRPSDAWEAELAKVPAADRWSASYQRILGSVEKHPIKTHAEAFQLAIAETAGDQELPHEAASVQEARSLFEKITMLHNRDALNIVFAEYRYKGEMKNGVPIHLIVDLGVDNGAGKLMLIDFKTGFITMHDDEMWGDDQVLMNLLLVTRDERFAHFPHKSFQFSWIRSGIISRNVSLSNDQINDYEYWLLWHYQHLSTVTAENAKENLNRFCGSCGRRNKCQKFRLMMGEAMGNFAPLDAEQIKAMGVDEVGKMITVTSQQMKILETRAKFMKGVLHEAIKKNAGSELTGKNFRARERKSRQEKIDVDVVLGLAQRYNKPASDLVSVRTQAVNAAFGTDPVAQDGLRQATTYSETTPWVEIIEVKPPKGDNSPAASKDQPQ